MDTCLLCLQRQKLKNAVGINVNSAEWLDENMEKIIEKHFWPIKSLTLKSWLCSNCWRILHAFHKFHTGIENAHSCLSIVQIKTENSVIDEGENKNLLTYEVFDPVCTPELEQQIELNMPIEKTPENDNVFVNKELENEPSIDLKADINLSLVTNTDTNDPLQKLPRTSKKSKISSKRGTRLRHKQKKRKEILEKNSNYVLDGTESHAAETPTTTSEEGLADIISAEAELKSRLYHEEQNKFVTENYTIKCGICQGEMETFQDVRKHCAMDHQQSGFVVCCNKKFYRRNILVEHLNWHLNPEYFKCKTCGKVLADRRCLEIHARVHVDVELTHVCDVCGKAFSRQLGLQRHKFSHLPLEERNFACKQCPKRFGSNDLLVEHTRSAHLTKLALICYICGKGMRTTAVYKRHMQQHEGIPPPAYSCDVCGLKVKDIHGLKSHKDTRHPEGGQKEFKCHLCPKVSPNAKALNSHIIYKHKMGLDFKCTICEKAFKRAVSLKEHMATHTGTELYVCPHCPKTFKSNANMHSHRKKAHPQMWEEAHREKYSGELPPNLRIL